MNHTGCLSDFALALQQEPQAMAVLSGSKEYDEINGIVRFFQTRCGVFVMAEVAGLPEPEGKCVDPVFAFHIHEHGDCSGDMADPFAHVMTHYNPGNCPHPYHAGDLPPLFGNRGFAFQVFLTDRFTVQDVIGRAVIIHDRADDFTTQPSGNSGSKIACGVIRAVESD